MGKILFLTSVYNFNEKGNLNTDLIDTFAAHGYELTVMTPKERKYHPKDQLVRHGNIVEFHFKCLNFRGKVNVIEKGISTLFLGYQYKRAWRKYFRNEKYDMIIYTTMPITYSPIIQYVKKKTNAFCYLQQKDFFPQSGVDLGMLKKGSMVYRLFRKIELQLFEDSDKIGVISPKNVEYILENNPQLSPGKVEVCPNGIIPTDENKLFQIKEKRAEYRKKYNIPTDKVVFLFGGNISRSQGVDFIKELLSRVKSESIDNAYFLIVGNGNGYSDLFNHVINLNTNQITVMPFLPKKEFDELLVATDVGMVFLDKRFTIANIPSRTLAHMDMGQPIIAATDSYTDYRNLLEENKIGLWALNGDVDTTIKNIKVFANDKDIREQYGANAKRYLIEYSSAERAYEIIMNSYREFIDK